MLSIRLARGGAKKRPYYNIVVAEKSFSRDGRFIERLGAANPVAKDGKTSVILKMERYQHWFQRGAQPTATVKRLVRAYARAEGAGVNSDNPTS